jgi:FkbM family methyltransferase
MSSRRLLRCARYVRALGVGPGIATFVALYRARKGLAKVHVPGVRAPIYTRRGTADADVFDQIFVTREYDVRRFKQWEVVERKYQQICDSHRRPVVVDCGANIGLASVYLKQLFPAASVVAIEPESHNFEMLQRNVAAYPDVTVLRAAVSDHRGWVAIDNPDARSWAFSVREVGPDDGGAVPAVTIDDARSASGGGDGELLAVKVDIEGAEDTLFRSNLDWLHRTPLLIVELHDWLRPWSGSSRSFFRALRGLNFDFMLAGENVIVLNWEACRV